MGKNNEIIQIICGILLLAFISFAFKSCSRSESDMIYIKDGYCYDEDTKIIHKEYESGRYGNSLTFVPYINENGNYCKYDEETGEWIEVIQQNEETR